MNNAKINRILRIQIIIELLPEIIFISIAIVLFFLGLRHSSMFFVFFVIYSIILILGFFLSPRSESVFIPLYKANKYSRREILDLVDALIEQYTSTPSSKGKKNTKYFNDSTNESNAIILDGTVYKKYRSSYRISKAGMGPNMNPSVIKRNLKSLRNIKDLLDG